MRSVSRTILFFMLAACALPLFATTWFVRPDGGTRYSAHAPNGECDGKADAAYPGKGSNRHCAFNDVRYMWLDGSYGNSKWVMEGGDTLVIRGCAALPSQENPDAPHCRIGWDKGTGNDGKNFWCAGVQNCSMPSPPSGTASQHTRILGACAYGSYSCNPVKGYPYTNNNLTQLFGGFGLSAVIYLNGSSYVDLEGLEITSHNGKCTRYGIPAYPAGCRIYPAVSDDFANAGIGTNNKTSNITLQDVYIHGFTGHGMYGAIGGPFTLTRVSIDFNTFAGWDFDDGTPDNPASSLTQSYVTFVGNGCLEEYPITHKQFPAKACWDSESGGFGDAWSGQNSTMESFTCDHCMVEYNAKDGAMGPHTIIQKISLTNSIWVGNMGQNEKWGQDKNATFLFQNNLVVGNCMRMSEQLPGAAQSFNQSTGKGGAYLSNFCRAAGDLFAYFADEGSTVNIVNNSFVTYQPTTFDLNCRRPGTCGNTPYNFTNNVFLGFTPTYTVSPFKPGEPPGLFYRSDNSVKIVSSHNLEYGLRNADSCGANGNICSDPELVNQPRQRRTNDIFPANFDFHPSGGSPVKGRGKSVSGLSRDYYGSPRPNPPSIGAVEPIR